MTTGAAPSDRRVVRRIGRRALIISALAVIAITAEADAPPPEIGGTVIAADGRHLTLRDDAGDTLEVTVAPDGQILVIGPLADIDAIPEGRTVQARVQEISESFLQAIASVVVTERSRDSMAHLARDPLYGSLIVSGHAVGFAGVSPRRLILAIADDLVQLEVPPVIDIVLLDDGDATLFRPGVTVTFYDLPSPSRRYTVRTILIDRESLMP